MTENNLETMERMLRAVALLAERDALSTTASTDGMRGQHISILAPEWRAGVWIAPADRADRMVIRYCVTPLPKRDGSREAMPDYVHGFSHWHQLPSGAWCCNRQ